MFRITHKAAMIALTAIIGVGLLGSAAFAAFAPSTDYSFGLDQQTGAVTMTDTTKADALKTILDGLVSKGVITQAQEDAILAAVKDARGDSVLRMVVAGLLKESATYLGFNEQELRARLPGTSLGALADKTQGKSRGGLIADLTTYANNTVDKLLAAGKITQDQADKAKAAIPERIAQFVDHVWPKTQPKPAARPNVKSFIGDAIKDATSYLGISQKDIATQLRSGKSLGDIANATPGKSREGLIDAVVNDANAKIDQAVQAGKLTADQATQLKSTVKNAVTQLVDHKGNAPKASN